ncbi:peptidoglycan endopeptidase [Sphingosinicella sp. LHD-64]|uniref:peptidoglycan endopeptidase n=1 Tax=Sphingosinicella sp. LHD-64 TaxID=3072139 RepID=UPI00280E8019|nr:peptidoglycan endopeptidase [Sphingosinicella sp. LHD-64]MDQ8757854.1 peptidoglycan endopeptidase [Sphingosinicella sp. LHD-64]
MKTNSGVTIVERARTLIGVRFRPKGRNAESGLDCVGVVAMAAGIVRPPDGYALRGGSPEHLADGLCAAGFRLSETPDPGDVLAMRAGPEQLHLGIWTGAGLVHADAGLRRVVERPGSPPWSVLGIWRRIFEEA